MGGSDGVGFNKSAPSSGSTVAARTVSPAATAGCSAAAFWRRPKSRREYSSADWDSKLATLQSERRTTRSNPHFYASARVRNIARLPGFLQLGICLHDQLRCRLRAADSVQFGAAHFRSGTVGIRIYLGALM